MTAIIQTLTLTNADVTLCDTTNSTFLVPCELKTPWSGAELPAPRRQDPPPQPSLLNITGIKLQNSLPSALITLHPPFPLAEVLT